MTPQLREKLKGYAAGKRAPCHLGLLVLGQLRKRQYRLQRLLRGIKFPDLLRFPQSLRKHITRQEDS